MLAKQHSWSHPKQAIIGFVLTHLHNMTILKLIKKKKNDEGSGTSPGGASLQMAKFLHAADKSDRGPQGCCRNPHPHPR